jgi:hypothetical protein
VSNRGRPKGAKTGSNVTQPTPFTIFRDAKDRLAVRIGRSKPSIAADEISLNAGLVIVTLDDGGCLRIAGEGVVRRFGTTIAITS